MLVYGQLEIAQLENLTADPTVGVIGRIWLNTTNDEIGLDKDGTTIVKLVDKTSAQTLTSKTLTGAILSTATITNSSIDLSGNAPATTNRVVLPNATSAVIDALARKKGSMYFDNDLDKFVGDNGVNVEAFGSGSGGINYVDNFDLEGNADGYTAYDDGNVDTPVDGQGGSPTLVISRNTATPLIGSADLKAAFVGATTKGQGFALADVTIDKAFKNQLMEFRFTYDFSDSEIGVNKFKFFLYDVTGTQVIKAYWGDTVNSLKGTHSVFFYTTANTSYRLIAHQYADVAAAGDTFFDNFSFGPASPQVFETGSVSAPETFVPSQSNGFGTLSSSDLQYNREGKFMYIYGTFVAGSVAVSEAQIELPDSLVIDTIGTASHLVGMGSRANTSNGNSKDFGILATKGDTYINFSIIDTNSTRSGLAPVDGNVIAVNSETMSFYCKIPILGWTAPSIEGVAVNSQPVHMFAAGNAGQVIGGAVKIPFISIRDTRNVWDGEKTNLPEDGSYTFSLATRLTAAVNGYITMKSNLGRGLLILDSGSSAATYTHTKSVTIDDGVAGEQIYFEWGGGTPTLYNDVTLHYLTIIKNTNPSDFILPTDKIVARYTSSAVSAATGANSNALFSTKDFDSHDAFDTATGFFTAPVTGQYRVTSHLSFGLSASSANGYMYMNIRKNNVDNQAISIRNIETTANTYTTLSGTGLVNVVKGDTININFNNVSGSTKTANNSPNETWVCFELVK